MKRALSIVSVSICCISSAAQLSFQANAPRGYDNVERHLISLASPGQCSSLAIWNLGNKDIDTRKQVARYARQNVNGDFFYVYDAGTRYGLKVCEDGVSVTNCENRDLRVTFDLPVKVLHFPMEYNDSIGGYFHGTGTYCDRWLTRSFGSWKLQADAKGRVILPSGDTLRAVRVHLRKQISNRYYPLDSVRSTLAAFNVDSILHCQKTDTAVVVSDEYRWYARGYRYPILEYRSAHMESRPGEKTSVAYYCPLENQDWLPLDEGNARIREGDRKNGDGGNGKHGSVNDADANGFRYGFTQDRSGKLVSISYTSDSPVSVKAVLSNSMGIVYRTETSAKGVSGNMTLGYGDLPHGQYIVHVKAGEKTYTEKFNHK